MHSFKQPPLLSLALCLSLAACTSGLDTSALDDADTSTDSGPSLSIRVRGLSGGLTAAAPGFLPASVTQPAGHEYDGIGVSYGNVVVESLKIWLAGISAGKGQGGSNNNETVSLIVWQDDPKEIEISKGFSGSVTTGTISVEPGTYTNLQIAYLAKYALKAWAYLDRNNDTTVDTTIWTTTSGVVTASTILAPSELTGYSHLVLSVSSPRQGTDVADPSFETGRFTVLPAQVDITEGATTVSLDVLIDSFGAARVWDGRFGTAISTVVGDGSITPAGIPFPNNVTDSRTVTGADQYSLHDLFPYGNFHFGLSYLPAFALLQGDGVQFGHFVLSSSGKFTVGHTQWLTLVMAADGTPILGQAGISDGGDSPNIGQTLRLAKVNADGTWNLATGDGENAADGTDDGGLNYNNDSQMARIYIENLPKLEVGETAAVTLSDGPRCGGSGSGPNHCYYGDGQTATIKRVD